MPILTPRSDYDVEIRFKRNGRQVVDWIPRFQSRLAAAAQAAEEKAGDEECYTFVFSYSPGRCPGLTAVRSFEKDSVAITVPRPCLDRPRAVRVAAETSAWEEDTDGYYRDERSDDGRQRLRPHYGAWVRSSAG